MLDIIITVAGSVIGFGVLLYIGLRSFKGEMYGMVDAVGDIFSEILSKPAVKTAFGILGSKSGEVRGQSALADKLATDILSGPKFGALKMGASALGINIDDYIEEHGAMNTITGLQSIAGALGININDVISGGLSQMGGEGQQSDGSNPYL